MDKEEIIKSLSDRSATTITVNLPVGEKKKKDNFICFVFNLNIFLWVYFLMCSSKSRCYLSWTQY